MKFIQLVPILALVFTTLSCDSEEARTPLGITVSAADFELTIEENPEQGALLGTLTAFASDDSTISFGNVVEADSEDSKFESETPIGALDIDNVTGDLTIKDPSLFDFELNTEINATVNAISGQIEEAINISIFINPDRRVLLDILEQNPLTTLDWDATETDISEWTGVTVANDRIVELSISGANLSVIPSSISNLSQINVLDLSNNSIETVPDSIGQLNNLVTLNLNSNQLNDLPESITEITKLTSLDISSNTTLTEISTTICEAFNSFVDDLFLSLIHI